MRKQYDARFEKLLNYIFMDEGGFTDDPDDRGGRTNFGITQDSYNYYRDKRGIQRADVQKITKSEAKDIYYEDYYKTSGANKQKDIRDAYILFDTAVNFHPVTSRAMFKSVGGDFYRMLELRKQKHREESMKPKQDKYLRGWLDRVDRIKRTGERLFKEENYSTPYNRQITPNFDKTLKGYMNADKINDDYIKNKIFYYMQKNQDAQNSFDPNYNANVKDITFADEDISKMTSKEFSEVEHIINNQLENNRFLTKNEAQNRVQQGNLIWVDEYMKADGTKVKGHYRAKAS